MKVEIISYTNNPIQTIAIASSMCYKSEPSFEVVKHCIKSGHTSVLEHANFTFKITGISRACLAQITRHRIASFSVQSQRYVNCEDNEYIYPQTANNKIYDCAFEQSKSFYKMLILSGEKKEDARAVLPNACTTEMVVTMNLRALGNFMNERLCCTAQAEIRQLALEIREQVLSCIEEEMRDFIKNRWLVPKCEKNSIPFCTEDKSKSCKKYKTLNELVK